MRDRVLAAAADAGRDQSDITCVYNVPVWIDGPASVPGTVTGSVSAVTDRLLELAALGFTSMNFMLPEDDARSQAERLAGDVLPALRSATG
ncbi:hypothetical protein GCM10029978_041200 [Actinoallomurus acanthiterrae]